MHGKMIQKLDQIMSKVMNNQPLKKSEKDFVDLLAKHDMFKMRLVNLGLLERI